MLCQADVSVDEDCRRMAEEALARWGRIDGLVNNAARSKIVAHHDLEGLTGQDFEQIFAVNVIGAYQMVRAVTPAMKQQGKGAIVNISSGSGFSGSGSSIAYAASKGALNTMTLSLARALGSRNTGKRRLPGCHADPVVAGRSGGRKLRRLHRKVCREDSPEGRRPSGHCCGPRGMAAWKGPNM